MEKLEQIANNIKKVQLTTEMGRNEIIKIGEKLEKQFIEVYNLCGSDVNIYSFDYKDQYYYRLYSDKKEFQLHLTHPSTPFFSFVIQRERSKLVCLAGIGKWSFQADKNRALVIPFYREYWIDGNNLIRAHSWPNSCLIKSERFFKELADHYPKHVKEINTIINGLFLFPEAFADKLQKFKISQLEELADLQNTPKGQEKMNRAAEKLEEKKVLLVLYRKKPEIFKQYFMTLSQKEQEELLHEIFELKEPDKELEKWLSENFTPLITPVWRDRVYGK